MPQITSLAWLPLKPDSDDTDAGKALNALTPKMISQPGLLEAYQGRPTDEKMKDSVEFIHVWENEEAYKASQTTELHAEAGKLAKEIVKTDGPPPYRNAVVFDKPFSQIAKAPVVRNGALFLPADVNKAAFEAAFAAIQAANTSPPPGLVGACSGWALDIVEGHPKMPKAQLYLMSSGWESQAQSEAALADAGAKLEQAFSQFSTVFESHHTVLEKRK